MAKKKYKKTIFNIKQSQISVPVTLAFGGAATLGYMWYASNRKIEISTDRQDSTIPLDKTPENEAIQGAIIMGNYVYINIPNGYNLAKALANALNVPYSLSRTVSKTGIKEVATNLHRSQYPAFAILFKEVADQELDQVFTRANKSPILFLTGTDTKKLFIDNMKY